jgi:ribosomal protein L32
VHRFLRGIARFWRCINPGCGKLLDSGVATCDVCGAKALPLALCRTCGWDFYTGREEDYSGAATAIMPWLGKRSTKRTTFLYDPPGDVEVEPEDVPEEGEEGEPPSDEAPPEVPDVSHRVCPQCLLLTAGDDERLCACDHPLRPVKLLRGRGTNCPVCRSVMADSQ